MAVVEPIVTAEKLRQLLNEGHESTTLDFKRTLAFDHRGGISKRALVDLAKDVAAMGVDGGYLVIGADDAGTPTGELEIVPETLRECFDEARLRNQLKQWIPEPLDLHTAVHQIDSTWLVMIYIGPRSDGFCVFCCDGNTEQGTVFRRGDVYVRHGSASERWQHEDIPRIMRRIVEREKEQWRVELSDDLAHLAIAATAQGIARGPVTAITWDLDAQTFADTVLELLRVNDDIPLRSFMQRAVEKIRELVEQPEKQDDVSVILDRLTCLAALAVTHHRKDWRPEFVRAFTHIYNLGFDAHGYPRELRGISAAELWLAIVVRIVGLGALMVRLDDWVGVQCLVVRPRQDGDFRYEMSWIRHGLTMAARSGLLEELKDGQKVSYSLLQLARNHVSANEWMRPDLPSEAEEVLDSLCQFDFLSGIVVIGRSSPDWNDGIVYPSFARFYSYRTDPIVARLIVDSAMRQELFPKDDNALAAALRDLNRIAAQDWLRFAVWDGFEDQRIVEFLRAHPEVRSTDTLQAS
jgi:hypothetical protein